MQILIIRFSSIGDIVLTFPFVRALRKRFPDAEIYFAVKEQFREILFDNSDINHIYPLKISQQKNILKLFDYIKELNNTKFDYVFDLHANLRSRIISSFVKSDKKFRYNKRRYQRELMIRFKKFPKEKFHTVDNYLAVLEKIGIQTLERVPCIRPRKGSLERITKFLEKNDIKNGDKLVAINPNASNFTKMWLAENFIGLSKTVVQRFNAKIILIGGSKDIERNNRIISGANLGRNIISSAGSISLKDLSALLSKCRFLITNDSGPMHIAVAVGTPVIALFGATVRELGFYPLGKYDVVLESDLPCRPCSLHGTKSCPKGHFMCMKTIKQEDIISTIINKQFFDQSL